MFRVDVPITDQHRSMIVSVRIGEQVSLRALSISEGQTIQPFNASFSLEDEVEITALLYDLTLEEMALAEGTVEPALDSEKQRALPPADDIAQLTIRDRMQSEWSDVPLPQRLADVRITAPDRCRVFSGDVVSLGMGATPAFVLALDDRWLLVGTRGREVFFVDSDRNVVKQEVPVAFFDGYRETGGTVWLGGERGAVYTGSFDPSPRLMLASSSTVSSREDVISLVGPPDGVPNERFALTNDRGASEEWGTFEWFDGTSWRVPGLRRNTPHDATWVAPGFGLFASFYRDTTVYGARDGAETQIEVTSVVFGSVVEIEQMPGLGLVAGTSAGEVHLQPDGGAWRSIAAVNIQEIQSVQRYEDGIVYLAGSTLIQWVDDAVCDATPPASDLDVVRSMAVLGGDVIVPLQGEPIGEQSLAWYAPSR